MGEVAALFKIKGLEQGNWIESSPHILEMSFTLGFTLHKITWPCWPQLQEGLKWRHWVNQHLHCS
jgi:hypothetical protein